MRDHARKAVEIARERGREKCDSDEIVRLALTHLVELVGEAANQAPVEIQEKYPGIPWSQAIGIRNRLIYGYASIDFNIVWDTIMTDFPGLLSELDRILQS